MGVQLQILNYQSIKMPHQKISQVKRARLGICQCVENTSRRIKFITVGAGYAFGLPSLEHGIESSAGAAIGICHESMIVLFGMAL